MNLSRERDLNADGVSSVIGAVLIFATVILVAGQMQTGIVPENRLSRELKHDGKVSSQFESIDNKVLSSAMNEEVGSAPIKMTTSYSQGTLMGFWPKIQPPSPGSELSLGEFSNEIEVKNVRAIGDGSTFWPDNNGAAKPCKNLDHCYNSSVLTYTVDYNEVSSEETPDRLYENTVMYEEYPNGHVDVLNEQSLIKNKNVNLVALSGDFTENTAASTTVDTTPVSSPAQSVAVRSDDDPITLELPTRLSEGEWRDILSNQLGSNGGQISSLDVSNDVLTLKLQRGTTYSLKMAKVHLSADDDRSKIDDEKGAYIAWAGNKKTTVKEGEVNVIKAQVRDRMNNPVTGEVVEAKAVDGNNDCIGDFDSGVGNCGGWKQPGKKISGDDGEVTFFYEAPEVAEDKDISISLNLK